jgi:hypothetical protein
LPTQRLDDPQAQINDTRALTHRLGEWGCTSKHLEELSPGTDVLPGDFLFSTVMSDLSVRSWDFCEMDRWLASAAFAYMFGFHLGKRRISALLQGQLDALYKQVMDFAPLVKGDLPQRLVSGFGQVDARMLDVWSRPAASGLR